MNKNKRLIEISNKYSISHFIVRDFGTALSIQWSSTMFDLVDLKIGKVLKQLMEHERHTITSISKATGIPKSTISEWLNNRTPNPIQAVKVASHLGVSLHFLLFGKDDSQEPIQKILKEDFFSGTFEITVKRVKLDK